MKTTFTHEHGEREQFSDFSRIYLKKAKVHLRKNETQICEFIKTNIKRKKNSNDTNHQNAASDDS